MQTEEKFRQMFEKADIVQYSILGMQHEVHKAFPVGDVVVTRHELEFNVFIEVLTFQLSFAHPFYCQQRYSLLLESMKRRKNVWTGDLAFQNHHTVTIKIDMQHIVNMVSK